MIKRITLGILIAGIFVIGSSITGSPISNNLKLNTESTLDSNLDKWTDSNQITPAAFGESKHVLTKVQLINPKFLEDKSFLKFNALACEMVGDTPKKCTANGIIDKGNLISKVNQLHPGIWGQIVNFIYSTILKSDRFDEELSEKLLDDLINEFIKVTGNDKFADPPTSINLVLEETITNYNGVKTTQLSWSWEQMW